MKNLFDATVVNQVKTRLGNLEPQSERRWGKMTVAQMLAHCSLSMQWAVGEVVPEKGALPARLMGRLVKPMVFGTKTRSERIPRQRRASLWRTNEIWARNGSGYRD
jgi:hypothetical protein